MVRIRFQFEKLTTRENSTGPAMKTAKPRKLGARNANPLSKSRRDFEELTSLLLCR